MADKVTVVIADSYEIVREGIAARLRDCEGIELVGEADDGFGTLKLCRTLQPDIVLLDLGLTRPSGMETLKKIRSSCPGTKVIILSSDDSFACLFSTLTTGAVAFMPKQSKGEDIVDAISAAARDFVYLPTNFLSDLVASRKNVSRTGNCFGLSPRELEILEASAGGQSTKEVAHALRISVRTVETHRNSIYRKTSCNCVDDLAKIVSAIG